MKPGQQDEMPELPTREQIHGGIYIAARYYDALRAHCERLVKEKRVYQHIAGGALHGTDHADRLAATHKNSPIDAHNAAYELWRKNQDETIEAIIKPLRERAESAESRLAALREEVRWITVSERLPDVDGRLWAVLTDKVKNGRVTGYYPLYEYYHFHEGWATDDKITHWLDVQLPVLPTLKDGSGG